MTSPESFDNRNFAIFIAFGEGSLPSDSIFSTKFCQLLAHSNAPLSVASFAVKQVLFMANSFFDS